MSIENEPFADGVISWRQELLPFCDNMTGDGSNICTS